VQGHDRDHNGGVLRALALMDGRSPAPRRRARQSRR
jgi:hypothetical protein